MSARPIEVLLVEDNPGDVRLTREALREGGFPCRLSVVSDGHAAVAFLRRLGPHASAPRPELILLDFNLPRLDGGDVLALIKADPDLRAIPVVVLTSSEAAADVQRAYDLHANCFITKPMDLDAYLAVVRSIEDFWLSCVRLPERRPEKSR